MQRLSYISKPRATPYRYSTIVDVCGNLAAKFPDREILIHHRINGDRFSINFEEFELKSSLLARYLYDTGASRKCPVSIYGPNSIEWAIGEMAVLKTGATSVHLSLGTTNANDAMDILKCSTCRLLLLDPGLDLEWKDTIKVLERKLKKFNEDNEDQSIKMILLRRCSEFQNVHCLDDILELALKLKNDLPMVYPEDPAIVFSTSGTTGRPKLISLSHFSLVNTVENPDEIVKLAHRAYNDRPFAWLGGTPFAYLVLGFIRIFTDTSIGREGNSPEFIWKIIKEEKCNVAATMPGMFTSLCEYKENCTDNDSFLLQYITVGGQIIDGSCKRAFGTICEQFIYIGYGSTEMYLGTSKLAVPNTDIKAGDVGEPSAGVEIKVVDGEGVTVPVGQKGEIYTRSRVQSLGYFDDPAKNNKLFAPGGWVKTGDIGVIEEAGNLVIYGRNKDIISRGTRKIIPAMIEEIIRKMKGLKEAVVVAVPDKQLYEEVCVCYVCEDQNISSEHIKTYCESHFLSDKTLDGTGEMPKYFVKIDTVPLLATGKYDKTSLRKMATNVLELS